MTDQVAMAGAASAAPGPGFYADPNDPKVERYWDGVKWTENRQPITTNDKRSEAAGVDVAGYVFAVLIPIVGFIMGLTQINKSKHGLRVVVLSVIAFVVWLAILQSAANDAASAGYTY